MMLNNRTKELLKRDSLAETEKMFGNKHWSQFNELENMFSLDRALKDNKEKKDYFKLINDTHYGMNWVDFKIIIKEHGFIPALEYEVVHGEYIDEFIIYYHIAKGLIIYADSYYNKETINGGSLYGEIKANNKEDSETMWNWISTGGCVNSKEMIYTTQQDIREGLFSKLQILESFGKFLPKWTCKNRFLYFVDYVENKVKGFDYKILTKEKILKCPKELQDIIGTVI